jgi:lysophospholipase L1-like esterase
MDICECAPLSSAYRLLRHYGMVVAEMVMKRGAFLTGASALVLAQPALARASQAAVRGLVLGDSIAFGFGASRGHRGFLQLAFGRATADRPGSRLTTVATGGAMVTDLIAHQVRAVARVKPDLAIVCVGGNDVLHQTPPQRIRAEYDDLLRRISARVRPARIVVCGVPDVSVSPLFSDVRAAVRRVCIADNSAVRAAAAAAGAQFVDIFAAMQHFNNAATDLGSDRFHPSDRGYAELSIIVEPAIRRALRA